MNRSSINLLPPTALLARPPIWLALACIALTSALTGKSSAATAPTFETSVQPFFQAHCLRCHDAQKQEGMFRLDVLSRDFVQPASAERWGEVLFRINTGEMPPPEEPQPKPEELARVVAWISTQLKDGQAARMSRRGAVVHYRLSRDEYGHTAYDLLGVHFDVRLPGALNDDPRWHGFDRIGAMLSLSPSHVDRYFRAAETVLQRAFAENSSLPPKGKADGIALAGSNREQLQTRGLADKVRAAWWPGREGAQIHMQSAGTPMRVRIQLSGLQPVGGRSPHLTVWDFMLKRSIFDEDIVAAEDKPIVVEFVTTSSSFQIMNDVRGNPNNAHTFSITSPAVLSSTDHRLSSPYGLKLFDDQGKPSFPLLLVDWVEWEAVGPSDAELTRRAGVFPSHEGDLGETQTCLLRFAERAWRRPVSRAEVERYMQVVQRELAAGENFRSAYLAALVGVLTSKNFYYLEEGSAIQRRDQVNAWELASRLSYFLWSSMPDEELFAAARSGTLHNRDVLRTQLTRMLADPKISRFTDSFPQQWLQLHRVGMFPPDAGLYPDYDKWLEQSMVLETTGYFSEMFSQNLPLREFLVSDWTMLNPRLALHYGMPALQETGLHRARLRPEDHRGGLLTQSSILMLTSDGTRHRPVHRGVWVSEAIFGKTPPSPPPNVEPLAPTPSNQPKATVRVQLEAHATHAICASCHRQIDPLGLAFDNFDAIGQWRTEEHVSGGQGANPAVNASGTLPDGRAYQNADEFKQLLVHDQQRFAEAFVEQLATYALRRVMTIDDEQPLKAIAQSCQPDYRLRSLIENFVTSELFQKR